MFIAHGTGDKNVPILSDDLFVAELLQSNRIRKVKYLILDKLDHHFNDSTGESHSGAILQNIIDWLDKGCQREVERKAFPQ